MKNHIQRGLLLKLFTIVTILCGISGISLAQQDSLHKKCSFDEYPLGALRYSNLDTLEKMIGANCGWSFYHLDSVKLSTMGSVDTLRMEVTDPFYYRTDTTIKITDVNGQFPLYLLYAACSAHDRRVYLPGTDGRGGEYDPGITWSKSAGRNGDTVNIDPNQWLIKSSDSITGTQYVLKDLTGAAMTDPYYGYGHFEQVLDSNHVGKASYEFVCFLDTINPAFTLDHNLPLFQIEYWVKPQFSNTWSMVDSLPITYNSYASSSEALAPATGKNILADSLGFWKEQSVIQKYHLFKKSIDIRPYYNHVFNWQQPADADKLKIDIRVKTFHRRDIFVRMLRIRDWRAQRLFTGAADTALGAIIDKIRDHTVSGKKNNMTERAWVFFDEPQPIAFHSIAYMNELLVNHSARPLSCLAPYAYDLLARVFRSQTKTEPGGIYFTDWYPFMGPDWRIGDINIDGSISKRYSDGYAKDHSVPIQIDVVSDSADFARRDFSVMSNYAAYTDSMQNHFIGYASDAGGQGWVGSLTNIAKSTTAVDPKQPFKFCMMGQAYVKRMRFRAWWIDSLATAKFHTSFFNDLEDGRNFADSLQYVKIILPYLNRRSAVNKGDSLVEDSLYEMSWFYRAPTRAEMMYQSWASAVAGLKGYSLSNAFSDGIEQVGFVEDSGNVRDIKSQNFSNVRLNEYRRDPVAGISFLEPWSRDSTVKTHTYNSSSGGTRSFRYRCQDTMARKNDMRWSQICADDRTYYSDDTAAIRLKISYSWYNRTVTSIIPTDPVHAGFTFDGALGSPGNGLISLLPLPPAFGGMFNGAKTALYDELGSVGSTLGKLQWRGTVSWHKRTMAPVALSKLPITKVSAKQLNVSPFSGIVDADSLTYVDISFNRHSVDSNAWYVILQNRRTWMDTNTTNAKGKIDYRTISFKVRSSTFGKDTASMLWSIKDVATGKDTIILKDSLFSFTFAPGQGRLFRIAPATALALGRMDNDLFNNARHICPVEVDNPSHQYVPLIKGYLATYARDGKIAVSYPIEDTSAFVIEKRHAATPVDSIVDGAGNCLTPSIAYNKLSNAIGLIYTSVIHGTTMDTNIIWYKRSLLSTPYIFTTKVLDTVIVNGAVAYYATPAIVPSNDTNHDFWVSWRAQTDKGGRVGIVNQAGILTSSAYFNAGIPSETAFISLGSHTGVIGTHIAWEEYSSWGFHDIHYLKAQYDGSFNVSVNGHVNLSAPSKWCDNHHPQIATDEIGGDHVVWEVYDAWRFNHDSLFYGGATVLRDRDPSRNFWGDYNEYFQLSGITLQNYLGADTHHQFDFFPNIASGGNFSINMEPDVFAIGSNLWKDFRRITWSNTASKHIDLMHWGAFDWKWNGAVMLDGSLEPSMAECSNWLVVPSAMLYRAPVLDEFGTNARMTRYRFPNTPVANMPASKLLWRQIWARGAWGCRTLFLAAMGNKTTINSASSTIAVGMHPRSYPSTDTTPPPLPNAVVWNDKSVRTDKFALHAIDTIHFQRYFDLGNDLNASDTASVKDSLTSYSDYLKARVYLRKNSDSSVVAILDTAILTKTGFSRTGTTNDIQGIYIAPSGFSTDTMFISMELMRGDINNSYNNIALNDLYGTDQLQPSISYKKSDPMPRPQSASVSEQIKVSVIPNPFHTMAKVNVDAQPEVLLNISLFDELGRKVSELTNGNPVQSHSEFTITSQTLAAGSYLLRVQSGDKVVTRKIQLLK